MFDDPVSMKKKNTENVTNFFHFVFTGLICPRAGGQFPFFSFPILLPIDSPFISQVPLPFPTPTQKSKITM